MAGSASKGSFEGSHDGLKKHALELPALRFHWSEPVTLEVGQQTGLPTRPKMLDSQVKVVEPVPRATTRRPEVAGIMWVPKENSIRAGMQWRGWTLTIGGESRDGNDSGESSNSERSEMHCERRKVRKVRREEGEGSKVEE